VQNLVWDTPTESSPLPISYKHRSHEITEVISHYMKRRISMKVNIRH
jgi:hypothetical protein